MMSSRSQKTDTWSGATSRITEGTDEGVDDPGDVAKSIRKEAEDFAELDSRSGATKKRSLKETEKCRDFTTTMSENDGSTIKVTKWS